MIKKGEGSVARWTTTMFFILSGLLTASWSSRIPDMQRYLQLSNAAWGTVLFAMPVGQVAGLMGTGWLLARFGVRRALTAATILLALVLVGAGASQSRIQLMIALFGLGFGRTLLNISVNTRATEVQRFYPEPIMVTFHGLWSLACFGAAGIGSIMLVNGWLPLQHFILIAATAIGFALLYEWRRDHNPHVAPDKRPLFVKPDRYLVLLGGITFCGMLCESVLFDWSVNFFDKVLDAPKALATAGYTAFTLAMTTGRLLGDRLVGRFGPIRMLMINGGLMAAGFLLAGLAPSIAPAIVAFAFIGLGASVIVPVVYVLAAKSKKMQPAYALAAVTLVGYCGFLAGPLLTGYISEVLNMQWAFGLLALSGLGICGLAFRLKSRFL